MSHESSQPVAQAKLGEQPRSKCLRKRIVFRFGAIIVGLLPLIIFELVLIFIGWQPSSGVADPYVGFSEIRPLFVKNEAQTKYEIAPNRAPLFQPDSFAVEQRRQRVSDFLRWRFDGPGPAVFNRDCLPQMA